MGRGIWGTPGKGRDPGSHRGGGWMFPQREGSEEEMDPGRSPGRDLGPGPGPRPRKGSAVQVLTQEHDPGLHQRDP